MCMPQYAARRRHPTPPPPPPAAFFGDASPAMVPCRSGPLPPSSSPEVVGTASPLVCKHAQLPLPGAVAQRVAHAAGLVGRRAGRRQQLRGRRRGRRGFWGRRRLGLLRRGRRGALLGRGRAGSRGLGARRPGRGPRRRRAGAGRLGGGWGRARAGWLWQRRAPSWRRRAGGSSWGQRSSSWANCSRDGQGACLASTQHALQSCSLMVEPASWQRARHASSHAPCGPLRRLWARHRTSCPHRTLPTSAAPSLKVLTCVCRPVAGGDLFVEQQASLAFQVAGTRGIAPVEGPAARFKAGARSDWLECAASAPWCPLAELARHAHHLSRHNRAVGQSVANTHLQPTVGSLSA